jgi:hypothetical protein
MFGSDWAWACRKHKLGLVRDRLVGPGFTLFGQGTGLICKPEDRARLGPRNLRSGFFRPSPWNAQVYFGMYTYNVWRLGIRNLHMLLFLKKTCIF